MHLLQLAFIKQCPSQSMMQLLILCVFDVQIWHHMSTRQRRIFKWKSNGFVIKMFKSQQTNRLYLFKLIVHLTRGLCLLYGNVWDETFSWCHSNEKSWLSVRVVRWKPSYSTKPLSTSNVRMVLHFIASRIRYIFTLLLDSVYLQVTFLNVYQSRKINCFRKFIIYAWTCEINGIWTYSRVYSSI